VGEQNGEGHSQKRTKYSDTELDVWCLCPRRVDSEATSTFDPLPQSSCDTVPGPDAGCADAHLEPLCPNWVEQG
jgi:hypothetical protein